MYFFLFLVAIRPGCLAQENFHRAEIKPRAGGLAGKGFKPLKSVAWTPWAFLEMLGQARQRLRLNLTL